MAEQPQILCASDLEVFTDDLSAWVVGFKIICHRVSFEEQSSSTFVDSVCKLLLKLYFSDRTLQFGFVCCNC